MPFRLPAEMMPGQLAHCVPTMANFDYFADIFRTGTDTWVLTFDSTHAHNCKWAPGGGGGGGTVTSITATPPIQVTPNPITATGDIEHQDSGVAPSTYGDATHVAQITVTAKGHITSASNVPITAGGSTGFFWALTLGGN